MKSSRVELIALSLCLSVSTAVHAQAVSDELVLPWDGQPMVGPQPPTAPKIGSSQPSAAPTRAVSDAGYSLNPATRETVRLFYKTVFVLSSNLPAAWSGNIASCNAGDTSNDYQSAALRRINWFRAVAGVPANIALDATFNRKAQQAALMMSANRSLSHFPPTNWLCYSADGAEAAGKSNIGLGYSGAESIAEGYLRDPGANNTVVGHRRWVLYPQTTRMGVGNVVPSDGIAANALWVQDGGFGSARPAVRDDFVAWPSKGYAPYQTVYPRWSFSYPNADFSGASLSMTENGTPIATRKETLTNGYGENTLVWLPGNYSDGQSWSRPTADTVYSVTLGNVLVAGQPRSFSYNVTVFDPDQSGSDTPDLTPQGSATLAAGAVGSYTFAGAADATQYRWRALTATALNLNDGAESGSSNFTASTSSGYSVISSDAAASGSHSFHLAHTQTSDQTLLLNSTLVPSASASLRFASRLGLSSPSQFARLEVSTDDGSNWVELWQQAGQQSGNTSSFGDSSFGSKTISLAAFADKTVRLRFRYSIDSGGSYYPQASAGIGWYIDDIVLSGSDAIVSAGTPTAAANNRFDFTAPVSGTALLQVQPGLYGYFSDWSAARRVSVGGAAISSTDCLLNWAERVAAGLLFPPTTSRNDIAPFTYRYYSGSNAYLGVSSSNQHVFYFVGGQLSDLGPQSAWLSQAGCQ